MVEFCPVCRAGVTDLTTHLEVHTKQEVVMTLLHQQHRQGESTPATVRLQTAATASFQTAATTNFQTAATANFQTAATASFHSSATASFQSDPTASLQSATAAGLQLAAASASLNTAASGTLQAAASVGMSSSCPPGMQVSQAQIRNNSFPLPGSSAGHIISQGPPGNLQIRRTLNNVNIVNNIGTSNTLLSQHFITGGHPALAGHGPPVLNPQPPPPSVSQQPQFPLMARNDLGNNVIVPLSGTGNPLILPPGSMMCSGLFPVNFTTPLLLPQVNGPTLLVNVPSNYVAYQAMPGRVGSTGVDGVGGGGGTGSGMLLQPGASGLFGAAGAGQAVTVVSSGSQQQLMQHTLVISQTATPQLVATVTTTAAAVSSSCSRSLSLPAATAVGLSEIMSSVSSPSSSHSFVPTVNPQTASGTVDMVGDKEEDVDVDAVDEESIGIYINEYEEDEEEGEGEEEEEEGKGEHDENMITPDSLACREVVSPIGLEDPATCCDDTSETGNSTLSSPLKVEAGPSSDRSVDHGVEQTDSKANFPFVDMTNQRNVILDKDVTVAGPSHAGVSSEVAFPQPSSRLKSVISHSEPCRRPRLLSADGMASDTGSSNQDLTNDMVGYRCSSPAEPKSVSLSPPPIQSWTGFPSLHISVTDPIVQEGSSHTGCLTSTTSPSTRSVTLSSPRTSAYTVIVSPSQGGPSISSSTTSTTTTNIQPTTTTSCPTLLSSALPNPSASSSSLDLTTTSVALSTNPATSSSSAISLTNNQPITVDTVEALHSALACNSDVQLVVSNDLLETPEFRALMFNIEQSGPSTTVLNTKSIEESCSSSSSSCPSTAAPSPAMSAFQSRVNPVQGLFSDYPSVTSSVNMLDESNSSYPSAISSRNISRDVTMDGFEEASSTETSAFSSRQHSAPPSVAAASTLTTTNSTAAGSEEDDITLQDLIAVETIDESQMPEDDMTWTNQLSLDSFHYISRVLGNEEATAAGPAPTTSTSVASYKCEKCGLYFASLSSHREHYVTQCSGIAEVKVQQQEEQMRRAFPFQVKRPAASSTATSSTSSEDSVRPTGGNRTVKLEKMETETSDNARSGSGSGCSGGKRSEPAEQFKFLAVKSELTVANQDPLAASGKLWKVGQGSLAGLGSTCQGLESSCQEELNKQEPVKASGKLACSSCQAVFSDQNEFILHRKSHLELSSNLGKSNMVNQVQQMQQVQQVQQVQRVQHVTKQELAEQSMKLERKEILPNANGEYGCDVCDRVFKERDRLEKHLTCHLETKPFECLECGKRFAKAGYLKEHRMRHIAEGSYHCTLCTKKFYSPTSLKEHIRTHTGEAPLKCEECGKGFKRHSNLSEHRKVHDPTRQAKPPKELFCHCGAMFTTQRNLDWHIESEHERKPKKCRFCGDVFTHSSSLTRHVRLKHETGFIPADKKSSLYANCPMCDQVFYKTSINKHIRVVHKGQRAFTCEICKKGFVSKCNLDNHLWQHKNQRLRPFKCNLCSKAYLREELLNQHMRSHQGLKPYVCNHCGVQFTMKSNYKRHVDEHTGARNHVCPECNKSFTRSYYLTDHMKVHSGEKPFICGICGKTAATRSNYNSHLKTHVTREPVNSEV